MWHNRSIFQFHFVFFEFDIDTTPLHGQARRLSVFHSPSCAKFFGFFERNGNIRFFSSTSAETMHSCEGKVLASAQYISDKATDVTISNEGVQSAALIVRSLRHPRCMIV